MTSLQAAVISFDRTAACVTQGTLSSHLLYFPSPTSSALSPLSTTEHYLLTFVLYFCFRHSTSPPLSDAAAVHSGGGSSSVGVWRSKSAPRVASPTFHPLHVGPLPALICSHGWASRCGSGCARAWVSWGLSAAARHGRDGRYKRGGFVPTMRCRVTTHE